MAMITLQDCIALCGLSEAEVLAIAEHEHVPEIVAAGLGETLLKQAHGPERVRQMIIDDIRMANERGDTTHVHDLLKCLRQFLNEHPEAVPSTASSLPHAAGR
jgi:hypothetical protein